MIYQKEIYFMEKVYLWQDVSIKTQADRPSITPFLLNDGQKHPAILIIPGGGYGCVCEKTEGTPIAHKFNSLGYHAFVLDYRVAPNRFPAPQQDAARAMRLIRYHADEWNVIADRVAICGFSAGGHLAGSVGVLGDRINCDAGDEVDAMSFRPDYMILCYGVLAFTPWSHVGTQQNLLGDAYPAECLTCSLPEHVNENTPPAFLLHTICDQVVLYRNSIAFAEAMAEAQRPCELALYYWGDHGMLLGNDTLDVCNWPRQAVEFMDSLLLQQADPEGFRKRYTHPYQAATVVK